MARCIERLGHTVDDCGFIHYDDRETTYERVERIAGRRLDRRKNYAVIDGKVAEAAGWTQGCSGCWGTFEHTGHGCSECGYTGRRRVGFWVPLLPADSPQEASDA